MNHGRCCCHRRSFCFHQRLLLIVALLLFETLLKEVLHWCFPAGRIPVGHDPLKIQLDPTVLMQRLKKKNREANSCSPGASRASPPRAYHGGGVRARQRRLTDQSETMTSSRICLLLSIPTMLSIVIEHRRPVCLSGWIEPESVLVIRKGEDG